ncbi:MAG: glycosyltransferase family 4 protein [Candidatus Atribacteria bacterium]|nr:glycosyltransferase family 4 protein [Candidatus Atribacteria bacterium]MCD6349960.1 glycosyltransferase family 4 protein [Candidatus Atribacteria bacterium]
MRILIITPTFLPIIGGAEIAVFEIARRLARHHKVLVLTPKKSSQALKNYSSNDPRYRISNFQTLYFNDGSVHLSFLKPLLLPFTFFFAFLRSFFCFKPDLVLHAYLLPASLPIACWCKIRKIPFVLLFLGRPDVIGPETRAWKKFYFALVEKLADLLVGATKFYLRLPNRSPKFRLIPLGIDLKRYEPLPADKVQRLREKLKIPTDAPVLFTLQRLDPVKKVDFLLRSFRFIQEKNPKIYLIIGGKGPEEKKLRSLARKLALKNVIFAGYIPEEEIPLYYNLADIFVFASEFETFGIVVAQALACGTPVVAVKTTALPEVISEGKDGVLVPKYNEKQFAQAVIKLLANKKQLQQFGAHAVAKAQKRFDWERIVRQLNRQIVSLVKKQKNF